MELGYLHLLVESRKYNHCRTSVDVSQVPSYQSGLDRDQGSSFLFFYDSWSEYIFKNSDFDRFSCSSGISSIFLSLGGHSTLPELISPDI
jgi:hypothetical protein